MPRNLYFRIKKIFIEIRKKQQIFKVLKVDGFCQEGIRQVCLQGGNKIIVISLLRDKTFVNFQELKCDKSGLH